MSSIKARDGSLPVLGMIRFSIIYRVTSCDSESRTCGQLALGSDVNFSLLINQRLTRYTMLDNPKSFVVTGGSMTEVHGNSYGKLPI